MADTVTQKVRRKPGVNFLVVNNNLSVYSRRLSPRARMVERGKPEWLLWQQRKVSRKTNYSHAGIGGSSKRMLACSGTDTSDNCLTRKWAEFELVQNGERICET